MCVVDVMMIMVVFHVNILSTRRHLIEPKDIEACGSHRPYNLRISGDFVNIVKSPTASTVLTRLSCPGQVGTEYRRLPEEQRLFFREPPTLVD